MEPRREVRKYKIPLGSVWTECAGRDCGQTIVWIITPNGKKMPVDPEERIRASQPAVGPEADARHTTAISSELTPWKVLAQLRGEAWTGLLSFVKDDVRKWMVLADGRIAFAGSDDPRDRIGQVLIERGFVESEELEALLWEYHEGGASRFCEFLIRREQITPFERGWALLAQMQRIVTSCLDWKSGTCRLDPIVEAEDNLLTNALEVRGLVLEELRNKREMLHVVITGRNAKDALIEMADLVTEMRVVKHPYKAGIKAQKGVEY